MNVVVAKTETDHPLRKILLIPRGRLPGAGKVADLRRQAFDAYEAAGLPHRRIEEWKYTDLRALMREVLPLAPAPDAAALDRARGGLKPVVITHYQRLLNYIVPDFVHVMSKGRVVKSGGKELALELEESGYAQFEDAA